MGSPITFIILGIIAVSAGLGMLLSRNAIHSALFLILNMVTLAVLYLVLNAPFIAMVQITVYAGAIMVLFLFVIMLLGAEKLIGARGGLNWQNGLAIVLGVALAATFIFVLVSGELASASTAAQVSLDVDPTSIDFGSPTAVGLTLFEEYVFPFEITSVLLLVAMVGVVVLRVQRKGRKNA